MPDADALQRLDTMLSDAAAHDTPDPAESPLLDEGSDGLVGGTANHVLDTLAQYAEEGHSLARIRRDFQLRQMGDVAVGDDTIKQAIDYARNVNGRRSRRMWGGIDLPTRAGSAQEKGQT